MDVKVINPFIESATNVLATMAQLQCTPGKVSLKDKDDTQARGCVTGVIEVSGKQMQGSLALSFSPEAISLIAKNMLGEMVEDPLAMASDLTGELTNIVAGGAKKILAEKGFEFGMAIPDIEYGDDHSVKHTVNAPVLILPFDTEDGQFFIEVSFKDTANT